MARPLPVNPSTHPLARSRQTRARRALGHRAELVNWNIGSSLKSNSRPTAFWHGGQAQINQIVRSLRERRYGRRSTGAGPSPPGGEARWNAACCQAVAGFLARLKLGTPPEEYLWPAEVNARTEEQLYRHVCERGVPAGYEPDMMAGSRHAPAW